MEYSEFRAMNSDIVLAAEGEPGDIVRGFSRAQKLIAKFEARFTRFSEASELSRLNQNTGKWFCASEELFDLVRQARDYVQETGGLFDPSILGDLEKVGYDKSMDEIRKSSVTQPFSVERAARSDWSVVRLEETTRGIHLPAGMRLDLGGIAKGWIAERAAQELARVSSACAVSAGGDMFLVGLPAGQAAWPVELEDPRAPTRALAVLQVGPGAVATSSIGKRRWEQNGRTRHHLIDPRTGEPAETDWLSVTVIAPQAAAAEVWAKALLIAGTRQAEQIALEREDVTFIGVDGMGWLWGSPNAKEYVDDAIERA